MLQKYTVRLVTLAIALLSALGFQPDHAVSLAGTLPNSRYAAANEPTPPADAPSAYTIEPLITAAQANDPQSREQGQRYRAMNPAQALQILFHSDQVEVTSATGGGLPWRLQMSLEGDSSDEPIDAAAITSPAVIEVAGNRLAYQRGALREWYINSEQGLKQGFTLAQRPAGQPTDEPLQLRLRVDGTLQAKLSSDHQAIDFVTATGAALLRYDALHVFDAQQRTLPAHFALTPRGIAIVVDDRGALYPLTIDPLLTRYLTKATASDGAQDDFLGRDVNVSGDTAIVGAYGDDNQGGVDAGAAYIFARTINNRWVEVAKLVAADGAAGDEFGRDTYVTSGLTAIVGAPGHAEAGAAYIFGRDQGGPNVWGQEAKLTSTEVAAAAGFGSVVSIQSNTAVVGAPGDNRKGDGSGAVYLFERPSISSTVWSLTKVIVAPDGAAGDSFGSAIVNSGDTLIVGAINDDDACPADPNCNSGSIYIFERNIDGADQWGLLKKLTAPDAVAGAAFGGAVNISDDRIIVGAAGDAAKGVNAGAAYIFEQDFGSPNNWGFRKKLTASDGAAGAHFGRSVGIGGNMAVVGAPFDGENGLNAGAAYLFHRGVGGSNQWGEVSKILASDGGGEQLFGYSVDQRSGNIVIGAYRDNDKGENSGSVYFYRVTFTTGSLQVINDVAPDDPNTTWNVAVNGLLTFTDTLTGDDQTAAVTLLSGTYAVTQSAGPNTNLNNYSTTWSCLINGAQGPTGGGATLNVMIGENENVVCTFTHRPPSQTTGTIVIIKQSIPEGGTDFAFTDTIAAPNSFILDDGGIQSFLEVAAGTYQVTETALADWALSELTCTDPDNGSTVNGATATIDLDAGETVTCTFTNEQVTGEDGYQLFLPLVNR